MSRHLRTFVVRGDNGRQHPVTSSFPWQAVRGLPRYPVQVLLGSDDLVGPDFLRTALDALAPMTEQRAIVTFQPYKADVLNRRFYHMRRYRPDKCSPFLAYRQEPKDPRYTWVWARGHTLLHQRADRVVVIPEGHCALAVHAYNDSSSVVERDVPCDPPTWLSEAF